MVKEEKPIFLRTMLLIAGVLIAEFAFIFYLYGPTNISGFSVANLSDVYAKIFPESKFFLYGQWVLIGLIIFFVFMKNKGILKRNKEKSGVHLNQARSKSKTDLDALYIILKEKKSLSVKSVASLFDIHEDLAMEWARILETGELVIIDYPGIGSPVLVIKEEEKTETNPLDPEKKIEPEKSNKLKMEKVTPEKRAIAPTKEPDKKEEKDLKKHLKRARKIIKKQVKIKEKKERKNLKIKRKTQKRILKKAKREKKQKVKRNKKTKKNLKKKKR